MIDRVESKWILSVRASLTFEWSDTMLRSSVDSSIARQHEARA